MPRLAATVSQLQDAVAHATSPAAHLPTARYAPHRPERTLLYSLVLMLPLFCGVLSSRLTRLFCAVPRTSVSRIA